MRTALLHRTDLHAAVQWSVLGSLAFALITAALLVGRRMAGALTQPISPAALLTTAVVVLAWASAVRAAWSFSVVGVAMKFGRWVAVLAPAAVIALLAVACSYPGNRWIDWLVWLPAIVANFFWPRPRLSSARSNSPAIERAVLPSAHDGAELVLQQLTRCRTADGGDVVSGTLAAEFMPGERTVTLHIAFCPPFERLPHVEAGPADDASAHVKVVQVLHNGARLDVRLVEPAKVPQTVAVELIARERT